MGGTEMRSRLNVGSLALAMTLALVSVPTGAQSPEPSRATDWAGLETWTPEQIDQAAADVLAADLERFGVTAFDPELPGILEALRQAGAQDLRDILSSQSRPEVPEAESRILTASIAGTP